MDIGEELVGACIVNKDLSQKWLFERHKKGPIKLLAQMSQIERKPTNIKQS